MPAMITPIDFMQILKSYDIIIPALDHKPTSNNVFVKLGKATGKISNFFTKSETKVISIFTYWAVESVIFSMIMYTAISYTVFFSALFLYLYGTYAIFSAINSLLK